MTDQGPLGRPPRGASVPGGAPCGAGPQLITYLTPGPRNIISVSGAELKLRWAPWTSMQAIRS
jgi:hypothetical protein